MKFFSKNLGECEEVLDPNPLIEFKNLKTNGLISLSLLNLELKPTVLFFKTIMFFLKNIYQDIFSNCFLLKLKTIYRYWFRPQLTYELARRIYVSVKTELLISQKEDYTKSQYPWIFKKGGYFWNKYLFSVATKNTSGFFDNTDYSLKNFKLNLINGFYRLKKLKLKSPQKYTINKNITLINTFSWGQFFVFHIYPNAIYETPLRFFFRKYIKIFYLFFEFIKTLKPKNIPAKMRRFKKTKIFERKILKIRKVYPAYYVYRTFKYAFHNYWCRYDYKLVIQFFKNLLKYKNIFFNQNCTNPYTDFFKIFILKKLEKFLYIYLNFLKIMGIAKILKRSRNWKDINREARKNKKKLKKTKSKFVRAFLKKLFNPWSKQGDRITLLSKIYNMNYSDILLYNAWNKKYKRNLNSCNPIFYQTNYSKNLHSLLTLTPFFKNKWLYSNYNPGVLLPTNVKIYFFKQNKISSEYTNHRFIQHYLNNFSNFYSNMKSLILIQSNHSNFNNFFSDLLIQFTTKLITLFKKINRKFFKKFQAVKIIEFFTFSLFKKDLNYFMKFFKLSLENTFLKLHKKIFYSFEFMMRKFFSKIFYFTGVKGFKFEVTGKISVTGNSKSRNKIIRYGFYSLTNKSLKIDFLEDVIRTNTGVLGLKMFITY